MNIYYILDKDNKPLAVDDVIEWSKWFGTAKRHVAKDKIGDVDISTVFLGINHRFLGDEGEPILFETMIFGGKHDQYQERYCTSDEAVKGHKKAVRLVKKDG